MNAFIRRCARTSVQKRYLSVNLKGSYFGFECSKYAHREYDLNLLEKSIRNGCNTVVEKSSSDDSIRTYQLLVDVAASEDVEIKDFFLMHLISDKKGDDGLTITEEINGIEKVLKKRCLDVAGLSIPSKALLTDFYRRRSDSNPVEDTKQRTDYFFSHSLRDYVKENFIELSTACGESTELGLDIPTEYLANATECDIKELLGALDDFNNIDVIEINNNSSNNNDSSINNKIRRISCLSVATNSFTHVNVQVIYDWAADRGIRTIATEILRTNIHRPGLLAVDGGRLKLTPTLMDVKEGEVADNNEPGQKVLNAVGDLNRALNVCIQAEKEYFSRFGADAEESVSAKKICWGHNLSQSQHTILYPEEWDYYYEKQVAPCLEDAAAVVRARSEKEKEWTLLYLPLSKKLFANFNTFLEMRRTFLCHDIRLAITLKHGIHEEEEQRELKDYTAFRALPQTLAAVTSVYGCSYVVAASTVVLSNHWLNSKEAVTVRILGNEIPRMTSSAIVYEMVRSVLTSFNSGSGVGSRSKDEYMRIR